MKRKKIVIIGGGFAGSYAAKKLEKDFDVTLVDSKDYFEFTPGVLRTIVEPQHIKKIQILHTHYLKRAKVIMGIVSEISKNYLLANNKKISFDYLVICSGSSYNPPFKEKKIVIAARAKHLRESYKCLCEAKRILIIGGGLVGVELAAEITTHYDNKKITIINMSDRLIERNPPKAIKHAEKFLKKRGVKIIYNEMVITQKTKNLFLTDKGNKFSADITFLCTGITPNFDFMKKNFSNKLDKSNQIKVNDYLQVQGVKNIFSAGDINDRAVEKTAQNAERQAGIVVKNIRALENKSELYSYSSKKTPLVISLGKYNGIFSWDKLTFTGIIPGIMKTLIEKYIMFRHKFL